MGVIAWIVLGLFAGIIAKRLMGGGPDGLIKTTALGIIGALVGGWLASRLFGSHPVDHFFDLSTWLTAIAGAALLIFGFRVLAGRR